MDDYDVLERGQNPSLEEAKAWLRARLKVGAKCPCCGQNVRVWKRPINSRQARALIAIYRAAGTAWCHIPDIEAPLGLGGSETARLRYWGLLEEATEKREDGGRAGWWRVTPKGAMFVVGGRRVPKYAHIYNKECLWLSGDPVNITEALGTKFDYRELMGESA
jgi:hypothetical protein